jgi:hypothetical protein
MTTEALAPPEPDALSCYTANLAVYLDRCEGGALGRIARSIRLAVRPDGEVPAFSHHSRPLDVLDGGGRLEYRGAGDAGAALEAISAEVARLGQCLVLANTGFLDWSTAGPGGQAPHLLLVDGRRRGEWHVVDRFAALLPGRGEQRPFGGWVSDAVLARCLTPISPLPPEQRLRNAHAFGFPRPLPPEGQYQWISRTERLEPGQPDRLDGGWLADADASLEYLGELWSGLDRAPGRARLLDDMWAAAQHHVFRYTYLLVRTRKDAEERRVLDRARLAWRDLPMALRFAVDSARRGRHRATLVARTIAGLRRVEGEATSLLKEGEPAWEQPSPTLSGTAR